MPYYPIGTALLMEWSFKTRQHTHLDLEDFWCLLGLPESASLTSVTSPSLKNTVQGTTQVTHKSLEHSLGWCVSNSRRQLCETLSDDGLVAASRMLRIRRGLKLEEEEIPN